MFFFFKQIKIANCNIIIDTAMPTIIARVEHLFVCEPLLFDSNVPKMLEHIQGNEASL